MKLKGNELVGGVELLADKKEKKGHQNFSSSSGLFSWARFCILSAGGTPGVRSRTLEHDPVKNLSEPSEVQRWLKEVTLDYQHHRL